MFLDFFDEVYVINLAKRQDRRSFMEIQLMNHGIPFTIFEATPHPEGAHGLIQTMKRLLTEAISKRQLNILVLEDDAEFLFPPVPFIAEVLPQLPKNYDLFYLGLNLLGRPERISQNLLKVNDCYATHAIGYSLIAMQVILKGLNEFADGFYMPYDGYIRENIILRNNSYCTFPMLATQMDSPSDIEVEGLEGKMRPWKKLMATTYAMHTSKLQTLNKAMATEIYPCHSGHVIDGVLPQVDENKFEIQNAHLIGKVCDCGRWQYVEGRCDTCQGDRWRITWKEKER